MKQRIFSGLQPSGLLHIGNYLGAIKNWVTLQDQGECMFCVVDYHAITVPQDPATLQQATREAAAWYVAAGVDPARSIIFRQSDVAEHTELAWIMACNAQMGELERMTQYKDKIGRNQPRASVGLFTYPLLMAADILLYDTTQVPVGDDQRQHIELTRDLAGRFNRRFGQTFTLPQAVVQQHGARIMGLDDPQKKMSKSASSEYNYIALSDDPATIRRKIKKAVTDSGSEVRFAKNKPAVSNLLTIYQLFNEQTPQQAEVDFAGAGYGQLKEKLAEVLVKKLGAMQERFHNLMDDTKKIDALLSAGATRAGALANKKMQQVRKRIGVR